MHRSINPSTPERPRDLGDLAIVIPTLDRLESLRETLGHLAAAPRASRAGVVVVDNAPAPSLDANALAAAAGDLPIVLVHEPRPGKGWATDRGVDAVDSDLVAILDDDMTPDPGWIDAVVASARRRPDTDVFAGRSYIIWPADVEPPAWADDPLARGIAFSVIDPGEEGDREMGNGIIEVPSGNHFWFRRSVRQHVPIFPRVWAPEADFVIAARLHGHRGIFVPEVRCGHRIQARLVDPAVLLKRARAFGHVKSRLDRLRADIQGTERGPVGSALRRLKSAGTWVTSRLTMPRPEAQSTTPEIVAATRAMIRLGKVEERLFGHRMHWCPRWGETVVDGDRDEASVPAAD